MTLFFFFSSLHTSEVIQDVTPVSKERHPDCRILCTAILMQVMFSKINLYQTKNFYENVLLLSFELNHVNIFLCYKIIMFAMYLFLRDKHFLLQMWSVFSFIKILQFTIF